MARIISYLHSPQTVSAFQRLCGIHVLDESGSPQTEPFPLNLSKSSVRDVGDGYKVCAETDSKIQLSNGNCIHDDSKLRHRMKKKENYDTSRDGFNTKNYNFNSHNYEIHQCKSDSYAIPNPSHKLKYKITNYFLYYLFCFGSSLGNEIFYISFFPFWFWNVDGYVGRRLCFFWALFMYLGQATKDVLKIPRPSSPPVVRMEDRYVLEFGMPSTHAMVGAGIPFGIYFLTKERYIFPSEVTFIGAILWCITVCCSRVYLGMHSVLDVIVGLLYVFLLMFTCFWLSLVDLVDYFVLNGGILSFILCLFVPLVLCVFYPAANNKWSTARGDTTIILAVCSGQMLSHWLSYQLGQMASPVVAAQSQMLSHGLNNNLTISNLNYDNLNSSTPSLSSVTTDMIVSSPPYPVTPLTFEWAVVTASRTILGLVILVLIRLIIKFTFLRLTCRLTGTNIKDPEAQKSLRVELPYKFTTYSILTICGLLVCPIIFRELGIERETYFTEL